MKERNKNKEGRKFVYPDSFINKITWICESIPPFTIQTDRQTEGIVRAHAANTSPSSIPDYSRICRRINGLDIKINDDNNANDSSLHDDNFVLQLILLKLKLQTEVNGLDINGK